MKPFRHPLTNRELGAPKTWDPRNGVCMTLPVVVTSDYVVSYWTPSDEERADIYSGRPVRLLVWGNNMPPVSLDTEKN